MATKFTFKEVCDLIKEDNPQLIETVDKLLGVVLVLSPVALGPSALPALSLLGAKNELIKAGNSIYSKLTRKSRDDFLARQRKMKMWTCVGSVDCFRLRTVRGKESIATNKPDLPTGVSTRSYPAG